MEPREIANCRWPIVNGMGQMRRMGKAAREDARPTGAEEHSTSNIENSEIGLWASWEQPLMSVLFARFGGDAEFAAGEAFAEGG